MFNIRKKIDLVILTDLLINFAVAIILFSFIYFFVAQPHQIEGNSMKTTFFDGDYLITQKVSVHLNNIQTGDIVVFNYPRNPSVDYIKRVIALPNETIVLRNGDIYINDQRLEEPYVTGTTSAKTFLQDYIPYTTSSDEYIVMGDNREESSDSREWGPITASDITGVVMFRYWPIQRLGLVQ
jgi:signal peptidase I